MARKRFPASLGDLVAGWIEDNCVHGPGDVYGRPVRLTDEEHAHLEAAYALDETSGRRLIDTAVYSRIKGTRKSELGAFLLAAEARGPVRAWLDEGDHPVAGPPHDPWILCVATTSDQSELVYGAFTAMVEASERLSAWFDPGKEETYLLDRSGTIQSSQSGNAKALEGARPTFEVADEAHLWLPPLHASYNALRRNLRKRKAAQPWIWLPTNAYAPGEASIHEGIAEYVADQPTATDDYRIVVKGRILHDHRQAGRLDHADPPQRRAAVLAAAGDAHWVDVDGQVADYDDPQSTPQEWLRFFAGRPTERAGQWCSREQWRGRSVERQPRPPRPLSAGDRIVIGFDGGRYRDATALVAVRVEDAYTVLLSCWERPQGPEGVGWEVSEDAVDYAVRAAMRRYKVVRLAADPPGWRDVIGRWYRDYGDLVREFRTNLPREMGDAIDLAETTIRAGGFAHDGSRTLEAHVVNAVTGTNRGHKAVYPRKRGETYIDAAVAWIVALKTRADLLAAGAEDEDDENGLVDLFTTGRRRG